MSPFERHINALVDLVFPHVFVVVFQTNCFNVKHGSTSVEEVESSCG